MILRILKISGNSLFPRYSEGDFVLIFKIPFFFYTWLHQGDVIVFRHTQHGLMIKEIRSVSSDDKKVFVVGSNSESVDSRDFGYIPLETVVGKVIWHKSKPGLSC